MIVHFNQALKLNKIKMRIKTFCNKFKILKKLISKYMKIIIHYKNNFQVKIFKVSNNKNHLLNINSKIRMT